MTFCLKTVYYRHFFTEILRQDRLSKERSSPKKTREIHHAVIPQNQKGYSISGGLDTCRTRGGTLSKFCIKYCCTTCFIICHAVYYPVVYQMQTDFRSADDFQSSSDESRGGIVPLRNGRLSGLRPLEPPALKRSGGAVTCQRVLPARGNRRNKKISKPACDFSGFLRFSGGAVR